MSLLSSAKEEFNRSPITAISSGVGVIIAGVSLLLAWIQFQVPSISSNSMESTIKHELGINVSNLLLIIAYFLAITITTVIILRAIAKRHDLAAFFGSIPVLALTNFSTILIIYLAPPREFNQSAFTSAHDLIFYGAAAITIAFCGKAVMADLISPTIKIPKENNQNDKVDDSPILGGFFFALIVMAVWGKLVFAGQVRLSTTLLPEITHPIKGSSSTSQTLKMK